MRPHLRDELQHGVGEERADGQADEVGQHFGEVRLARERDEQQAQQRRQVDHRHRQEAPTPNCAPTPKKNNIFLITSLYTLHTRYMQTHFFFPTYDDDYSPPTCLLD